MAGQAASKSMSEVKSCIKAIEKNSQHSGSSKSGGMEGKKKIHKY